MSLRWIESSKKILNRIRQLEESGEKDRLDYVRDIRFMLIALHRSILGWMQWVNNPDVMTKFTKEDLEAISKKLSKLICSFIEYDLEVTRMGAKKGLTTRKKVERRRRPGTEIFYV